MTSDRDNFDHQEHAAHAGDADGQEQDYGDLTEAGILRDELTAVQAQLDEARAELAGAQDRYLRARAELDNYRRRAAADQERSRAAGVDEMLAPVLTVFDDLQRAVEAADDAENGAILPGVRLVLSNLEKNLSVLGIEANGAAGEVFNPELHEAVSAIPAGEEHPAGTIAQVLRSGFKQGERLIRPAIVVVYNG